MKKVLYITNLPAPYKIEFLTRLSREFELTVLIERKDATDRDPQWMNPNNVKLNIKYLNGIKYRNESSISISVLKHISKKYDAIIINGYSSPTMIIAILYLSVHRIPFIISCDGMVVRKKNSLNEQIKSFLLSKADIVMSSGEMNTRALLKSKVKKDSIRVYPFSSVINQDVDLYVPNRDYYKEKIGCKSKYLLLFVGQMIYRKGVDTLIESFKDIQNDNIELMIVGGGEPYFNVPHDSRIVFVPFKNKEELSNIYRAADLFVLPTREDIWGLVVNEAMAHGCPVITTNRCGAGIEMIENGIDGFIIPPNNPQKLKNVILANLDERLLNSLSHNALKKASMYTIERMTQKTVQIINEQLKK